MGKALLALFAGLIALVVVIGTWVMSVNNRLVTLDEQVKQTAAQVQNVYQRRLDLIPNLVATVKGYAKHESQVFEEVARARSQAGGQITIDTTNPEAMKRFEQAQGTLSGALSRLLAVSERYPELKADRNFRDLQSQLEGTENRITIERQRMNEAIRELNATIRRFPQSIVAGIRNFREKPYFEAQPGAATAPKVEF